MATEGFELQFERQGNTLPVTGFLGSQGFVLGGETDAWPLGLALRLEPVSAGTKSQWENIQRMEGWIGAHTFRLNLSLREERLRFEGIRPGLLPPGMYSVSVCVSGYRFHHRIHEFTIPEDGTAIVRIPEKPEKRRLAPRALSEFDDQTRGIVERSSLDQMPLAQWLADSSRRDSRKACLLNVLAKLRTPVAGIEPLSAGIQQVIFADVDRIYAKLEPRFSGRFLLPGSGFDEDSVIHSTHLNLLKKIPNGPDHSLHSVREAVATNSLQLAIAVPANPGDPEYADIDIDLGNPFVNPLGFFIHVGELIDPGKTDHIALFKKLRDSASSDFLYYEVEES